MSMRFIVRRNYSEDMIDLQVPATTAADLRAAVCAEQRFASLFPFRLVHVGNAEIRDRNEVFRICSNPDNYILDGDLVPDVTRPRGGLVNGSVIAVVPAPEAWFVAASGTSLLAASAAVVTVRDALGFSLFLVALLAAAFVFLGNILAMPRVR